MDHFQKEGKNTRVIAVPLKIYPFSLSLIQHQVTLSNNLSKETNLFSRNTCVKLNFPL